MVYVRVLQAMVEEIFFSCSSTVKRLKLEILNLLSPVMSKFYGHGGGRQVA